MGKYFVDFKEEAKNDILKIRKSGDKSTIKKLEKIILELSNNPTIGVGNENWYIVFFAKVSTSFFCKNSLCLTFCSNRLALAIS